MTAAIVLDLALLVLLVGQGVAGWRRGLLTTTLGLIGLVAGAALALWGLPQWIAGSDMVNSNVILRSLVMLLGVLVIGAIGYGLLGGVGQRIMERHRTEPIGRLDSFFGAGVSTAVALLVIGLMSLSLYPVVPSSWRGLMDQSRIVTTMSSQMPAPVLAWAARATETIYEAGLPRVFGDPGTEPDLPTGDPNRSVANSAAVREASRSVVKVNANMSSCARLGTGSGWVVADQRIVTNAHVVAGANAVNVQVRGTGPRLRATVVAFDPNRDLAILAVPSLQAQPLERAGSLRPGSDAVVSGFPLGGPQRTEAARIRGTITALGTDIYDQAPVQREVYSIHGQVNHGNSGGPLLTPEGAVAGTIFAKSSSSSDTAFALTDDMSSPLLADAANFSSPVSTQSCTRD